MREESKTTMHAMTRGSLTTKAKANRLLKAVCERFSVVTTRKRRTSHKLGVSEFGKKQLFFGMLGANFRPSSQTKSTEKTKSTAFNQLETLKLIKLSGKITHMNKCRKWHVTGFLSWSVIDPSDLINNSTKMSQTDRGKPQLARIITLTVITLSEWLWTTQCSI